MPAAPSLRVRDHASNIQSRSIRWCKDVNTRSGCSLACSAIHCRFVYTFIGLRVPSVVSRQWVWFHDTPLSSFGSRWTQFPAIIGTMRVLRLPAPACPSAYCFASRVHAALHVRVRHGAPDDWQGNHRAGSFWFSRRSDFRRAPHGRERDLSSSPAIHPATLRRPKTPDDPACLASDGRAGAAPGTNTPKASSQT